MCVCTHVHKDMCICMVCTGCPGGSDDKQSACTVGDPGLISELRRSPEKGMAAHSSILACSITWTEEPGGLQSTGSQGVGQD